MCSAATSRVGRLMVGVSARDTPERGTMMPALATMTHPVGRRKPSGRSRVALCAIAVCFALVTGGAAPAGAGSTPLTNGADLSDSPTVVSSTATKTIVQSANLSTTNQNMWGSGAGGPTDAELTLFNETWNESDTFGDVEEVCVDLGEWEALHLLRRRFHRVGQWRDRHVDPHRRSRRRDIERHLSRNRELHRASR